MVSTLKDWKEVGSWYEGLQAGRTTVTPEIQDLASKLTRGKGVPVEKADAIYTYVSQAVRYVAVEMGVGGYQAHAASDVFKNGYGDCKDKTGLTIALLAAAGFKAYPAAVRLAAQGVEPSIPMPGQFDHVLVAVPLGDRLLWLDPILELAPMGVLARELKGKTALLMEHGETRLQAIPEKFPVPEQQKLTSTGKLNALGQLELGNQIEIRGAGEVVPRRLFRLGNDDANKKYCEWFAERQVSDSRVEDAKSSDPTDLHVPFGVSYRLTRPRFFAPLERSLVFAVPLAMFSQRLWAEQLDKFEKKSGPAPRKDHQAKEDLKLDDGVFEESLELQLDPNYSADVPSGMHFDRQFASYDSSYSFVQGQLKARRTLTVKTTKLSAERWSELSELQKLIDRDLGQKLALRRVAPIDVRSQMENLSADDVNRAGYKALEAKDYSLARDLLSKATEKLPEDHVAWNNLGRAYIGLQMYTEAERALQQQIKVNPKGAYAYNNLGRVYLHWNQFEEAIEQFKKQLEINPLDPYAIPNLADAYERVGRWRESAEAWEKAVAITTDQPNYLMHLAHALIKTGKIKDAREPLDRALEKDKSAQMANQAAWALADGGVDLDRAERLAKSAVEQAAQALKNVTLQSETTPSVESFGSYLDTLGWVYFQKGQLTDSKSYLEAAHALNVWPKIAEHLALLRVKEGDMVGALEMYACAAMDRRLAQSISKELEEELKRRFRKQDIDARIAQAPRICFGSRVLQPAVPQGFTYPVGLEIKSQHVSLLGVLVDEAGSVEEVDSPSEKEPYHSAMMTDAKQLHFPQATWPGGTLRTVRTVSIRGASPGGDPIDNCAASHGEVAAGVQNRPGPVVKDCQRPYRAARSIAEG
jgi:tetratricopeptide (TPR) repeat protein